MIKFKLGDIVTVDFIGDSEYYVVTDIADFSYMDKYDKRYIDIECEVMKIYPVSRVSEIENVNQDCLNLNAEIGSVENGLIFKYIAKERQRQGFFDEPDYIKRIKATMTAEYQEEVNSYKEVEKPKSKTKSKKKAVFGEREIKKILSNNSNEKVIEDYVDRLNSHLELLNIAINNNDKDGIKFYKDELHKVRNVLMELEYFPFERRRR